MHTNSETIPGTGTKRIIRYRILKHMLKTYKKSPYMYLNSIKTENLINRYYHYEISKKKRVDKDKVRGGGEGMKKAKEEKERRA